MRCMSEDAAKGAGPHAAQSGLGGAAAWLARGQSGAGGGETRRGASRLGGGEQSNTNVIYNDKYLLKFLRKFEVGPHPGAEILKALGECQFAHVPQYAGEIRCRSRARKGCPAIVTTYVKNQGDGWTFTLDAVSRFLEEVLSVEGAGKGGGGIRGNGPGRVPATHAAAGRRARRSFPSASKA